MREILFRGKQIDNGEWIEGSAIWFDDDLCFIMPPFPSASTLTYIELFSLTAKMVIPETVGQYTGLTDKNSQKIFEDDIINFEDEDGEITKYVIFWSENEWAFTDSYFKGTYGELKDNLDKFVAERSVVSGSVHDDVIILGGKI